MENRETRESPSGRGRIRNIVFDVGGVLVQWNPARIAASVFAEAEECQKVLEEIFHHADWREFDRGALSDEEAIAIFSRRCGLAPDRIRDLLRAARETLEPLPDSIALLNEFAGQGLRLFCLSNMPTQTYDCLQRRFDFWSKFEAAIISGRIGLAKPDREIFDYLLRTRNLRARETVFIDDVESNVEAARRTGMSGVLFRSAGQCRSEIEQLLGA